MKQSDYQDATTWQTYAYHHHIIHDDITNYSSLLLAKDSWPIYIYSWPISQQASPDASEPISASTATSCFFCQLSSGSPAWVNPTNKKINPLLWIHGNHQEQNNVKQTQPFKTTNHWAAQLSYLFCTAYFVNFAHHCTMPVPVLTIISQSISRSLGLAWGANVVGGLAKPWTQ